MRKLAGLIADHGKRKLMVSDTDCDEGIHKIDAKGSSEPNSNPVVGWSGDGGIDCRCTAVGKPVQDKGLSKHR